jgi:hypothetical protein
MDTHSKSCDAAVVNSVGDVVNRNRCDTGGHFTRAPTSLVRCPAQFSVGTGGAWILSLPTIFE